MRSVLALLCVACTSASSAPSPAETPPHAPGSVEMTRAPVLGDATATGRVIAVHAVAAVDDGVASDRPTHARIDQHVALHAVLVVETAGKRTVHSDAKAVVLANRRVALQPL